MLSILLIPCFVKAEQVNNNTEIKDENVTENNSTDSNEKSSDIEDNTKDEENNTLNEAENTTENNNDEESTDSENTTDTSLIPNATAGILMDATTGEIIFEKIKMNN